MFRFHNLSVVIRLQIVTLLRSFPMRSVCLLEYEIDCVAQV
jgi:hypothetical protein